MIADRIKLAMAAGDVAGVPWTELLTSEGAFAVIGEMLAAWPRPRTTQGDHT